MNISKLNVCIRAALFYPKNRIPPLLMNKEKKFFPLISSSQLSKLSETYKIPAANFKNDTFLENVFLFTFFDIKNKKS